MFPGKSFLLVMLTAHLPVFAESGYPLGLEYAERIGATLGDFRVAEAAADGSGALYLLGYSNTSRYVVKVPPAGDTIQWKLPLQNPSGNHLAVGPDGSVFVSSFLALPLDHAFVEKIRADGMGIASRLDLGAGLSVNALTVDPSGRAWIAGHTQSHALIPTPNALQTTLRNTEFSHGFVVRLNAAGTALEYATYLGGCGADIAFGIAVDTSGSAFVAGWTTSTDFPFSPPLLNAPAVVSNGSGFLTRIAPNGSQLIYSVPTGGPDGTLGYGASPVALDSDGNATIYGSTHRLIKRFSPDGKLTYSKTLPSLSDSLAVDSAGNAYVTGISTAANLPMKNALAPCGAAYLMVFSPSGDLFSPPGLPEYPAPSPPVGLWFPILVEPSTCSERRKLPMRGRARSNRWPVRSSSPDSPLPLRSPCPWYVPAMPPLSRLALSHPENS